MLCFASVETASSIPETIPKIGGILKETEITNSYFTNLTHVGGRVVLITDIVVIE